MNIHLGYEVGTGKPVEIPLGHLCVTGQTQLSGKTTTLEALIDRSKLTAISFVTKRGEGRFEQSHRIPPFFRQRADWQFVAGLLEATLREKLKFQRPWIMKVCRAATDLKGVLANVISERAKSKGLSESIYTELQHYLEIVVPQLRNLPYASTKTPTLKPGVNVMDLVEYSTEVQSLIIQSVLGWVYEECENTIVIIPEAWEFLPQDRGNPVKLAAETYIRKAAGLKNYLWVDSQDVAGVDKTILKQCSVWIMGVQREHNEVVRALKHIPFGSPKPKPEDIMSLEIGQFYVSHGKKMTKTYVQPSWMPDAAAIEVAVTGEGSFAYDHYKPKRKNNEDENMDFKEMYLQEKQRADRLQQEKDEAPVITNGPIVPPRKPEFAVPPIAVGAPIAKRVIEGETANYPNGGVGFAELVNAIKQSILQDPAAVLIVQSSRPELVIEKKRKEIVVDGETLKGRVAGLIAEGFFESMQTGHSAFVELKRRGAAVAKPSVYDALNKYAEMGFVTKEKEGYVAVAGMKANIREVA